MPDLYHDKLSGRTCSLWSKTHVSKTLVPDRNFKVLILYQTRHIRKPSYTTFWYQLTTLFFFINLGNGIYFSNYGSNAFWRFIWPYCWIISAHHMQAFQSLYWKINCGKIAPFSSQSHHRIYGSEVLNKDNTCLSWKVLSFMVQNWQSHELTRLTPGHALIRIAADPAHHLLFATSIVRSQAPDQSYPFSAFLHSVLCKTEQCKTLLMLLHYFSRSVLMRFGAKTGFQDTYSFILCINK